MSDFRKALSRICKICYESSQYSRRTAAIHEEAMQCLGYTEGQRKERHVKAMERSEQYMMEKREFGEGRAKKLHTERCEVDTQEKREKIKRWEGME